MLYHIDVKIQTMLILGLAQRTPPHYPIDYDGNNSHGIFSFISRTYTIVNWINVSQYVWNDLKIMWRKQKLFLYRILTFFFFYCNKFYVFYLVNIDSLVVCFSHFLKKNCFGNFCRKKEKRKSSSKALYSFNCHSSLQLTAGEWHCVLAPI